MLTVAVRPPEFLPRLAYCALFFRVDRFVVADTFPFSRQSLHSRARVRTPEDGGARWLTIPVRSGTTGRPLNEAPLADEARRAESHRRALAFDYGTAPFYPHVSPDVLDLLDAPWPTLGALTSATVAWAHRALQAPCDLVVASDLPGAPSDLSSVVRSVGADRLVTLPESAETDHDAAEAAGVALDVVAYAEPTRRQHFPGFVPGLSVLDLLMNYGPEAAGLLRAGLPGERPEERPPETRSRTKSHRSDV